MDALFYSWGRGASCFGFHFLSALLSSLRLNCIVLTFFKDQSQLKNKEKELKKLSDLLLKLEEKSQADNEAVKAAQDHFHAVSAGLSSNEGGEDKTLADQIMSKFYSKTQL